MTSSALTDIYLASDIHHHSDKTFKGVTVLSDSGSMYEIIGSIDGHFFAKSTETGQIVRIVRTGWTMTNSAYRARFEFAEDMNDVDGHVGFTRHWKVGGTIWSRLVD